MGDRHVVHSDRGWRVEKEGAKRPSATAETQAEAVQRAMEIVGNDGGGKVIVHGKDGAIRATHDVESGAGADAAKIADVQTKAAGSKAKSETKKAAVKADEVAETAKQKTDDAVSTAKDTAEDVAAKTEETARAAADSAADATLEAKHKVESTTDDAQSVMQKAAEDSAAAVRNIGEKAGEGISGTLKRVGGLFRTAGDAAASTLEQTRKALRGKGKK